MNNSNEDRLKIAVFVDFDNVAIGVKQSLNRNFDIGTVLEAIKEKGQVISKIAYGDWKRNEDFSRAMTQHAVQMVQRNLTPGGDKNGADIALALDALEMTFTRSHINAYVIVGGDSDFIALVEKLKQYDKTVFVVGGRAFTSVILQKNCHEFISYENLVGIQSGSRRSSGKAHTPASSSLENALPLVRRALKILSDREVSPQLGLLKSTLLQLDSTFSERDYGVSSFRDFTQKLANAGYVNLKQVDRSLLVELKEGSENGKGDKTADADAAQESGGSSEKPAASEAVKALEELLKDPKVKPHWPMYLRTFKQFLRSLQPPFDERQHGMNSTYDFVRHCHREQLLHVERNRQGILRIFPGDRFPKAAQEQPEPSPEPILEAAPEAEKPDAAAKPEPPETVVEGAEPAASETSIDKEVPQEVKEKKSSTKKPAKAKTTRAKATKSKATKEKAAKEKADKKPKPKPRTRKKTATATAKKTTKTATRKTKSTKEKPKEKETEPVKITD
jgi:uncharacterized LabA/DUF88 family protein